MNTHYLTINEGDLVPLETIKRVRIIDDNDRASLARLGPKVDASRFHTLIDMAQNQKSYAVQTFDELASQGVAFVQIDERAFVPASNIIKARNLTKLDRERFQTKTGRTMREDFLAQIDTKAGNILATVTAETVMERMAKPYVAAKQTPNHSGANDQPEVQAQTAAHQMPG